jgi:hypothetical protein
MNNHSATRALMPVIFIAIAISVICLFAPEQLLNWNIDPNVLLIGNLVLVGATLISFVFYTKSLSNNRPAYFMRMIYSAMFTKMGICLITAFLYIVTYKKNVSRGAIFACMFLYFVYTFIELAVVLKLSKEKKNA